MELHDPVGQTSTTFHTIFTIFIKSHINILFIYLSLNKISSWLYFIYPYIDHFYNQLN